MTSSFRSVYVHMLHLLVYMHEEFNHLKLLLSCLLLEDFLELLNHVISTLFLKYLLDLRGHCIQHEASHFVRFTIVLNVGNKFFINRCFWKFDDILFVLIPQGTDPLKVFGSNEFFSI